MYWATAASIRALGENEFALRLPPALFTVGEVVVTCAIADQMFGAQRRNAGRARAGAEPSGLGLRDVSHARPGAGLFRHRRARQLLGRGCCPGISQPRRAPMADGRGRDDRDGHAHQGTGRVGDLRQRRSDLHADRKAAARAGRDPVVRMYPRVRRDRGAVVRGGRGAQPGIPGLLFPARASPAIPRQHRARMGPLVPVRGRGCGLVAVALFRPARNRPRLSGGRAPAMLANRARSDFFRSGFFSS